MISRATGFVGRSKDFVIVARNATRYFARLARAQTAERKDDAVEILVKMGRRTWKLIQ